jgi:uncharacterized protein involved in exopolysaccharide biosynthesis
MGKDRNDGFKSFLRIGLLKWLIIGSPLTFLIVYFVTSPVFVQPQYRAEALIYVPLAIFTQQYEQQGIGFGGSMEIDGHIQLLHSTQILDSLEVIFGFAERWDIDLNKPDGRSRLYETLRSRIKIEKTRYSSVSVTVRDADPELAASMANELIRLGDVIKEIILFENRLSAYHFALELYEQKLKEVTEMEHKMRSADFVPRSDIQADRANNYPIRTLYEAEIWAMTELKSQYEAISKSLQTPLPGAYVISPGVPSHNPYWPQRVLLSLAAVVLFVLLTFFIEMIRLDA